MSVDYTAPACSTSYALKQVFTCACLQGSLCEKPCSTECAVIPHS
jgi:hypothetical protein